MSFIYKKKVIGSSGEKMACEYLRNNNYTIMERNFKCAQGEIDIIAYDTENKEIVFFEVKTRTNFNYGYPCEAVNKQKQRHILNTAKYYIYCKGLEESFVRIDVIEIVTKGTQYKLNHLRGVI